MPTFTLAAEKQTLLDLHARGEDQHWQMGVHYNNIVDNSLAEKAGFPTAKEFFDKQLTQIGQTTLSVYGAVAKTFPEAQAQKYGVFKLYFYLSLEKALKAAVVPDPGVATLQVPDKDGKVVAKKFEDCTVADLQRAIAQLKAPPVPLSAADQARVAKVEQLLKDTLGEHHHVKVKAEMHGREAVLSLEGIPMSVFSTVIDALRQA